MRLNIKNLPAREASWNFFDCVRLQVNKRYRIEKESEEIDKYRYSHQDWAVASETTLSNMEQKVK